MLEKESFVDCLPHSPFQSFAVISGPEVTSDSGHSIGVDSLPFTVYIYNIYTPKSILVIGYNICY